jgi:hypothetical protein
MGIKNISKVHKTLASMGKKVMVKLSKETMHKS